MDRCDVEASAEGTTITLAKRLPPDAPPPDARRAQSIAAELEATPAATSLDELQQQNDELGATLAALRERQVELARMARELEDTNRGVVALYAEIEGQADALRRAGDLKSRFLSHMSHEFRTPLGSIRAIARMLLDGTDGPLATEQLRQVGYIATAATELAALVDDLLDLAKIEAGKVEVRPAEFEIGALFGALRGMMRPLRAGDAVELVFDEPHDVLRIVSDETKVAQILRNLISNALKFTPAGEVRVSSRRWPGDPARVELSVSDTGIGLAPEHLGVIFEEFSQVEHPLQRSAGGTGLGLPLCRRLADLLGGTIHVESMPGRGSRFCVVLPIAGPEPAPPAGATSLQEDGER
jgi:signal transduction histidine kinase